MDALAKKVLNKEWQVGQGSLCGAGSDLKNAAGAIAAVNLVIDHFNIKSILDAACGDGNWISKTKAMDLQYVGIDYVPELLKDFNNKLSQKLVTQGNVITMDLPKVDLIICRDFLGHLPSKHGIEALQNFKRSKSTFLLATHFPFATKNYEIVAGDWFPINLNLQPYYLQPIYYFYDAYGEFKKHLALFKL